MGAKKHRYGNTEYTSSYGDIVSDVKRKTVALLNRGAVELQAVTIQKATGRPGPNVQTGNLRRRITTDLAVPQRLQSEVRSLAPYSGYLEYGTRYMGPYPFMRPAVEQFRPRFENMIIEMLEDIASGG